MHNQVKTLMFSNVPKLAGTHSWVRVFITSSKTAPLDRAGQWDEGLRNSRKICMEPPNVPQGTQWDQPTSFDFMKEESKSQSGSAIRPRSPSPGTKAQIGGFSPAPEKIRVARPQAPVWTFSPHHMTNLRGGGKDWSSTPSKSRPLTWFI